MSWSLMHAITGGIIGLVVWGAFSFIGAHSDRRSVNFKLGLIAAVVWWGLAAVSELAHVASLKNEVAAENAGPQFIDRPLIALPPSSPKPSIPAPDGMEWTWVVETGRSGAWDLREQKQRDPAVEQLIRDIRSLDQADSAGSRSQGGR